MLSSEEHTGPRFMQSHETSTAQVGAIKLAV